MKTYYISIMLNTELLQCMVETECFSQLMVRAAKALRLLVWKEQFKNFRPSELSWAIWDDLDKELPIVKSNNWNQKYYLEAGWD